MLARAFVSLLSVLCLFAGVARASTPGNVLVFPPDGRDAEMEANDSMVLQKAIESDLGPALSSLGYTVLTEETARELLQDKHIDGQAVRQSDSYLAAARALKLSLFVTERVTSSGGMYAVEVRLFDAASGKMLASGDVEGEDGASLRKDWKRSRDRFLQLVRGNLGTQVAVAPAADGLSAKEVKELRAGCDRAEPSKCLRLGRVYEKGDGVRADAAQAQDYYGRACSGGYPEGCAALKTLRVSGH
jgi:hypothetical protein